MIEIEITTALLLYLGSILLFFLGVWMVSHLRGRKKKGYIPSTTLATCEYCHFPYLARAQDPISTCPQCHSLNRKAVGRFP